MKKEARKDERRKKGKERHKDHNCFPVTEAKVVLIMTQIWEY